MSALDDANAASQLRHDLNEARRELCDTRDELDAALATVATLSSRLTAAERKARLAQNAHETAVSALARARGERDGLRAGASPSSEVEATAVIDGMKMASITQSVVVDSVVEHFTIELRQQARHTGIRYELSELNVDQITVNPRITRLSADSGAAEHEHDTLIEHVLNFQIRLVADRECDSSDDELATELGHDNPSRDSGDDATPSFGTVS